MPEGGVKLKNLTGYTTYMISVAPFNAAGDGPRSPATRGRTQQAGTAAASFTAHEPNGAAAIQRKMFSFHMNERMMKTKEEMGLHD